jgi:NAD(P)-dependent dehydrogenase (short-subunit alcohol dehydrogenase family)
MSETKTVLITGASSGIGFATSRQLAAGGARVVMVSRDLASGATARDDVVTGQYFYHGRPSRSKPITYDATVAARLWSISESLTGAGERTAMEAIT